MLGLLFTYGITAYGAVIGFVDPFRALLVYICLALLRPNYLWFWSVPPAEYSRIVGISFICGWVLTGLGSWNLGRARLVVIALICFLLWSIVSLVVAAEDINRAMRFVELMSKIVIPFVVGITTIKTVGQLKALAWVILASQSFVAYEMNLSYYVDGVNRLRELGFGGVEEGSASIGFVTATGVSLFMVRAVRHPLLKAALLLNTASLAHMPMLADSRGGMLGLCAAGFVALLLVRRDRKARLLVGAAIVLGLLLAGPNVRNRFSTMFEDRDNRDSSAQSRLDLWRDCVTLILEEPVFGIGPYNWPAIGHRFGWKEGKEAHTLWLQIGAETGIPGLLLLLLFYGSVVFRLRRLANGSERPADPIFASFASMTIVALAGFAVSAQFISLWALEIPYYVALLGACTLVLQDRMAQHCEDTETMRATGERSMRGRHCQLAMA